MLKDFLEKLDPLQSVVVYFDNGKFWGGTATYVLENITDEKIISVEHIPNTSCLGIEVA